MTSNEQLRPSGFAANNQAKAKVPLWTRMLGVTKSDHEPASSEGSGNDDRGNKAKPEKWSMGVLNDRQTDEVPGTS